MIGYKDGLEFWSIWLRCTQIRSMEKIADLSFTQSSFRFVFVTIFHRVDEEENSLQTWLDIKMVWNSELDFWRSIWVREQDRWKKSPIFLSQSPFRFVFVTIFHRVDEKNSLQTWLDIKMVWNSELAFWRSVWLREQDQWKKSPIFLSQSPFRFRYNFSSVRRKK